SALFLQLCPQGDGRNRYCACRGAYWRNWSAALAAWQCRSQVSSFTIDRLDSGWFGGIALEHTRSRALVETHPMCGAAGNGCTDAVGVITCTAETENWVLEPGLDCRSPGWNSRIRRWDTRILRLNCDGSGWPTDRRRNLQSRN